MKKLVIVSVVLFCLSGGLMSLAADFTGDGHDDIAVFRENTGLWAVRGLTRLYFGSKLDIPIPGNYFGGSAAEIGVFRPRTGLGVSGVGPTQLIGNKQVMYIIQPGEPLGVQF